MPRFGLWSQSLVPNSRIPITNHIIHSKEIHQQYINILLETSSPLTPKSFKTNLSYFHPSVGGYDTQSYPQPCTPKLTNVAESQLNAR